MQTIHILLLSLLLFLSACASGPKFDTSRVDMTVTPRSASAELPATQGQQVLWGGIILNTHNQEALTRLEILAYPLNSRQMPLRDSDPLGRFILEYKGFLEPTSYTEGRLITVVGTVTHSETGKIGGTEYVYPIIETSEVHLWSRNSEFNNRSNMHFGIGVGIRL